MNLPKSRTHNIVVQTLGAETLIYDLDSHKAFNLNETSTIVLNHCDGRTTLQDLIKKYKFTDDLINFALDELQSNNLLDGERTKHFAGMTRREVVRRVGLASMVALPVVAGLIAPRAAHAASCGNCNLPNATSTCTNGTCAISSCNSGYGRCNGRQDDGCETNLNRDPNNCRTCGNQCFVANGTSGCFSGTCGVASCDSGYGNCGNGCSNLSNDPHNCSQCGRSCPSAPNATVGCVDGNCVVTSCSSGFASCNGNTNDSCETNIYTNPGNCGECNHICPNDGNSTAGCSGGRCTLNCNTGYAKCKSTFCDTNIFTDRNNCGACNNVCAAGQTCSVGKCV